MIINGFTVDVEDYFHVSAFADRIDPRTWETYESRVVASTRKILALLERHQVHGTFFVLGWVARKHPEIVAEIHRAGHVVGCHSYWHRLIYNLTPDEFRDDLILSRDVLQEITGVPVTAYRAPSFSVIHKSLWALDILVQEGFALDSSVFPVYHDRYGIPGASIHPTQLAAGSGTIWEFPPTVLPLGRYNLPVGGGGYLRLYPARLTQLALSRLNQSGRPFQIYVHPWEVDPDQPRLPAGWKTKFRHYVNLRTTESKLDRLLRTFHFGTLEETLRREIGRRNPADPARAVPA